MQDFKQILWPLSFILCILFSKSALAEYYPQRGNVYLILSSYTFKTNYEGAEARGYNSGGAGFTILGDVNDHGSLEVTTLYMNKMYFRRDNDRLIAEKAQIIHVSMGYRYWWNNYFATSMSLYTSYPLGDSEKLYDESLPDQQIATTAQENSETGLDFGIHTDLWSQGRYALVLEGRYSWALTKKHDEFADQYGVLIGLRYFFQGKDKPNP